MTGGGGNAALRGERVHPDIPPDALEALLDSVCAVYGYDLRDYARASLSRRVAILLERHALPNVESLREKVVGDAVFFSRFLATVTVPVTEMFRDPEFFRALVTEVFPYLRTYADLRIWIAGCASGEEVYSLLILLEEQGLLARTQVYATDINPVALERARSGVVDVAAVKEATSRYLEAGGTGALHNHYTSQYGSCLFSQTLLSRAVFSDHNLVTDGVFAEAHLILCRNVLIYFRPPLKERVVHLFGESLAPGGFLGLGLRESLPDRTGLKPFAKKLRLFRKAGL